MIMAKLGDGHVEAMVRLGLKELRNAANPSRESVADTELGLYGTLTQGEIASARGGAGEGPEQETLTVDSLRADAHAAKERQQDRSQEQDRGKERDRGEMER
jgi:hypothetical protein